MTVFNIDGALLPTGILLSSALPQAPAASNTWANTGNEIVFVRNASAGSITVTFVSNKTVKDGSGTSLTVEDRAVTVAAGETKACGPFPPNIYNDSFGDLTVTFSAFVTVTVGIYQFVPRE